MIEIINKDTVKITTERIVDLRPLKKRLIDIESELIEVEKEPDMTENEMKEFRKMELRKDKEEILKKLKEYNGSSI